MAETFPYIGSIDVVHKNQENKVDRELIRKITLPGAPVNLTPARGDIITAQGVTPAWAKLAKGTQGDALRMGANEPEWVGVRSSMARVYLGTDQTITHNVVTKITLDTENFDVGGNFASNKYTCPVTGYYQVNFAAGFEPGTSTITSVVAYVFLSGSGVAAGSYAQAVSGGSANSVGSDLIYATAGQYLELYVWGITTDAGTTTFKANSNTILTYMTVQLVSK